MMALSINYHHLQAMQIFNGGLNKNPSV